MKEKNRKRGSWAWWATHVIVYVRGRGIHIRDCVVWENVVMVKARGVAQASRKAERMTRMMCAGVPHFEWKKRKASLAFAGIRLVREFISTKATSFVDGEEVSYCEYSVPSLSALRDPATGKKVRLNRLGQEEWGISR